MSKRLFKLAPDAQKKAIIAAILLLLAGLLFFALAPQLTLENLSTQHAAFLDFYQLHPQLCIAIYLITAFILTGLALPFTGILAVMAGALFGFYLGWLLIALSSSAGAVCVFLWARYFFGGLLRQFFGEKIDTVNHGIEKDGALYLFSLRLIAVFPFFVVNIACGLTSMKLPTYFFVTLIGQSMVVSVWVFAGAHLSTLSSTQDIITVESVIILAALGLAPIAVTRAVKYFRHRASDAPS